MEEILAQLMSYVDEIAGLVSDAAPIVWEMLMRQVYVEAVGSGLAFVASWVVIVFFLGFLKKREIERTGDGMTSWLASTAAFVFSWVFLCHALARLINPAWYAVQLLLDGLQ